MIANKKVGNNESEEFDRLYEKYSKLVMYVALQFFKNRELAEDAVQNVFIKIFRFSNKIFQMDDHKATGLVVCITQNCCKDVFKTEKRYKEKEKLVMFQRHFDNADFSEASVIEKKEMLEHINRLPEIYKNVLMLKIYYGFSNREIAQLLDITESNARKIFDRARIKAYEILKEMEETM